MPKRVISITPFGEKFGEKGYLACPLRGRVV